MVLWCRDSLSQSPLSHIGSITEEGGVHAMNLLYGIIKRHGVAGAVLQTPVLVFN